MNDERLVNTKPEIQGAVISQQQFSKGQVDEVELKELWAAIWKGKWVIICVSLVFAVCSIFYALSIQNEYQSTAILTPASTSSSSSLSKLAGKFGGFASLAGINVGGGDGDKTAIALRLIKTWGFLEEFIKNNSLEVEVFAVTGWDKQRDKLLINKALFNEKTSSWVRNTGSKGGGTLRPTSWGLFQKLNQRITVSQDAKTGIITLSVEHFSPAVAKRWVDLLVVSINRHIQLKDRKEALDSIAYLKEQINKTDISEMRVIFFQLIEEQTKTLMLAEISSEYVFKTLSPAKVAEQRSKPKRATMVVFGTILGGGLAVLIVLIRFFISRSKNR